MDWKPVRLPTATFDSSKEVVRKIAALDKRVSKLIAERQVFDKEVSLLRGESPENTSPKMIADRDTLLAVVVDLLKKEIELRRDILEFIDADHTNDILRIQADRAEGVTKAIEDLKQKLVAIGYVDTPVMNQVGAIIPMMYLNHPDCRRARELSNEGSNLAGQKHDLVSHHEEAIGAAMKRLQEFQVSQLGML